MLIACQDYLMMISNAKTHQSVNDIIGQNRKRCKTFIWWLDFRVKSSPHEAKSSMFVSLWKQFERIKWVKLIFLENRNISKLIEVEMCSKLNSRFVSRSSSSFFPYRWTHRTIIESSMCVVNEWRARSIRHVQYTNKKKSNKNDFFTN